MHERTEHERRRVATLCVEVAFAAQPHIPCAVVDTVRELATRYGVEVGIEVAVVVLKTFEAGHSWGLVDAQRGSEGKGW